LKARLYEKGKQEISQTLTEFKNNCLEVFRTSSSSEIALFQRMQLPSNNRWLASSSKHSSVAKKEVEQQLRLSSFQSLKKKGDRPFNVEEETISRIEHRLDDFLCRSVKYRKVYL
jgi:hypothetical protein